ncbi:hypothetical protein L1987_33915 [Smallanthus sonchifolius]|uniref:Uncharacterized protein n=1 Tax=Smallanthus sonchifolius TaxID=185202 RepID=A0ACB9HS44_9ASTR|nr:hypothetical protein L1987_33915 [Smallanthus sonchifolius]
MLLDTDIRHQDQFHFINLKSLYEKSYFCVELIINGCSNSRCFANSTNHHIQNPSKRDHHEMEKARSQNRQE